MRCRECSEDIPKGRNQCPSCHAFQFSTRPKSNEDDDGTKLLSDASIIDVRRIQTGPWDVCFGGGLVSNSVVLIGGAPGGGKSTLSLQLAEKVCELSGREVLYIASEESANQIRDRAERLRVTQANRIRIIPVREGFSGDLDDTIQRHKPACVIVDSLPGLSGGDHGIDVSLCKSFKDLAIRLDCPFVVIDHVTKTDDFAGLMALQHEVDALVTLFPRDNDIDSRRMFTQKNRFGALIEVCFTMTEYGLRLCKGCDDCKPGHEDEDE